MSMSSRHTEHVSGIQEQMEGFLYEGMEGIEGSDELYRGIKENGGVVEPLVVQVVAKKYIVREGNRRLACLKRLKKEAHTIGIEGQPRDRFDKVPCAILPGDVTREDLAVYLGHIHVVGKKDWPTYNKAWLVYNMNGGEMHLPYQEIAKHLGMSKATKLSGQGDSRPRVRGSALCRGPCPASSSVHLSRLCRLSSGTLSPRCFWRLSMLRLVN